MGDQIRTNENGKVWVKLGRAEDKYLRVGKFKIPNNFLKGIQLNGCAWAKTNEEVCVSRKL